MYKLLQARALDPYQVWLCYEDGTEGVVDLSGFAGRGVFEAWRDPDYFGAVEIGEYGELRWGSEIDLDPDELYMRLTGKEPGDLFPNLRESKARGA